MPHKDPEVARQYFRQYRENNRNHIRNANRDRQRRYREQFKAAKSEACVNRTCSRCGLSFPVVEFHDNSWCKQCKSDCDARYRENNDIELRAAKRAYYHANKDRIRTSFEKRKYGVTPEQRKQLLDKQNGGCAICRATVGNSQGKPLAIDHDHKTGKVRGLLCSRCNTGIGQFLDDPELLARARQYLINNNS